MARRRPDIGEGRSYDLLSAEPGNTLFFVPGSDRKTFSLPGHLNAHNPLTARLFLPNVFFELFCPTAE